MRPGPAGERHSSSLLHQARFLIANADASSIGILSDQRESKGPSHRSALLCRRSHLLIASADASSIGILSDQRQSKGPPHRSALLRRRSHLLILIANLELEIHITAAFSIDSIFLIANILRFF